MSIKAVREAVQKAKKAEFIFTSRAKLCSPAGGPSSSDGAVSFEAQGWRNDIRRIDA